MPAWLRPETGRHLAAVLALVTVLGFAAAGTQALAWEQRGPGVVWVVLRDAGGVVRVLQGSDLRLLDVRLQGRLVAVHADSLADVRWPREVAWWSFVLPPGLALAGCG